MGGYRRLTAEILQINDTNITITKRALEALQVTSNIAAEPICFDHRCTITWRDYPKKKGPVLSNRAQKSQNNSVI